MDAVISPNGEPENITLEELVSELGPHTVALLGPADNARTVRGTDFYDSFEELGDGPGTLLLAPSTTGVATSRITALAEQAARLGYAAIAVKCHEADIATYSAIAETSGIAFIRVSEKVGWRVFDALIAQLLGERTHSEDAHRSPAAEPLFALANELAGFFGGSVAIEDLGRRIIAYSSVPGQLIDRLRTQGILTRSVPASPFNDDQYRTVLRSETPIKYPQLGDEEPRVAFAIRAGALPLGTIWAIDSSGEGQLTEEQALRMREMASLAASHMLDDIRVRKATRIPREDRLRTLLDGDDVMGSGLAELGFSEDRGGTLLVFAPTANAHPLISAQLRATVQQHLALHRPEAVSVVREGLVYAFVADDASQPATALVEPLLPIVDRLIDSGIRAAVPGVANRSSEVAQLRDLAVRMLDIAAQHPATATTRLLTLEMMRPLLIFERAAAMFASSPELLSTELKRLKTDDALVAETLLTWCSCFGNIARTARLLGIHENTVRYRLNRVEEKYLIPLDDPDTLLISWLQLRAPVGRFLPAAVGSPASDTRTQDAISVALQ